MNKRQRKKQQKKQDAQINAVDYSKAFDNLGVAIAEAVDKVRGWLEAVPRLINKQIQERPEEIRAHLLGKEGRLLGWERLLLEKCEAEILQRIQEKAIDSFLRFHYVNWKGEQAIRSIRYTEAFFGISEYHAGEQWFVRGYDLQKKAMRDFALRDMTNIEGPEETV